LWLDFIGYQESAHIQGVPLIEAYASTLGILAGPGTLDDLLGTAINQSPTVQRREAGNIELEAKAYQAGSYFVVRLDACDRMNRIERLLKSGDPCSPQ
jgi:hypothetical protein